VREAGAKQGGENPPGAVPPAPSGAAGAGKSADKPVARPAAAMVSSPKVTSAEAAMAHWIGTRYGVAPDAIAPLLAEADSLTGTYRFSPNLLIAVMAIESNFHPYIQSEAGAQGLMQVMPKIHSKRYEKFGGKTAFMDPIVSLRVGAEILRDCIKLKEGSETEGLRFYFGGGPSSDTYIQKVRAEQQRLNLVARGVLVPTTD
jgi:soluble lytic murein transglycosylase-like protein